jgi:hypothetical protein
VCTVTIVHFVIGEVCVAREHTNEIEDILAPVRPDQSLRLERGKQRENAAEIVAHFVFGDVQLLSGAPHHCMEVVAALNRLTVIHRAVPDRETTRRTGREGERGPHTAQDGTPAAGRDVHVRGGAISMEYARNDRLRDEPSAAVCDERRCECVQIGQIQTGVRSDAAEVSSRLRV